MSAKVMRRGDVTCGGAVTGMRDLSITDNSEWSNDNSDSNMKGPFVQLNQGPYDLKFALLARNANIATGYCDSLVFVGKEVDVTSGVESETDRTWTLTDGYIVVDLDAPTDSLGRLPVRGQFETMAET